MTIGKKTQQQQTEREYRLQEVGIELANLLRTNLIKTDEEADAVFTYAKKIAYGEYRYVTFHSKRQSLTFTAKRRLVDKLENQKGI